MLEKVIGIGLMLDFYGALLTPKQQQCLELHYLNDLSLSEIAEEFNVSRQAVYDILRRAEQTLCEYEEKLRLVCRYQQEQSTIQKIYALLSQLPDNVRNIDEIRIALNELNNLLD